MGPSLMHLLLRTPLFSFRPSWGPALSPPCSWKAPPFPTLRAQNPGKFPLGMAGDPGGCTTCPFAEEQSFRRTVTSLHGARVCSDSPGDASSSRWRKPTSQSVRQHGSGSASLRGSHPSLEVTGEWWPHGVTFHLLFAKWS